MAPGRDFENERCHGENHDTLCQFTTLRSVPAGVESYAPYSDDMVKLDEGPMVEAMLTDVNEDELAIGMKMEMVTRKIRENVRQVSKLPYHGVT